MRKSINVLETGSIFREYLYLSSRSIGENALDWRIIRIVAEFF